MSTPRTNENTRWVNGLEEVVDAIFARQLERDLAAVTVERDALLKDKASLLAELRFQPSLEPFTRFDPNTGAYNP